MSGAIERTLRIFQVPRIVESFLHGRGMGWRERVDGFFHGYQPFAPADLSAI